MNMMALLMSLAIPENWKAHNIPRTKPKREERTYSLVSQHGQGKHMEAWTESNSCLLYHPIRNIWSLAT